MRIPKVVHAVSVRLCALALQTSRRGKPKRLEMKPQNDLISDKRAASKDSPTLARGVAIIPEDYVDYSSPMRRIASLIGRQSAPVLRSRHRRRIPLAPFLAAFG
jgi:hypothetical protein